MKIPPHAAFHASELQPNIYILCSMHAVICFYDALSRCLSLTLGARDAFLCTALGHNRLPVILSAHKVAKKNGYFPSQ